MEKGKKCVGIRSTFSLCVGDGIEEIDVSGNTQLDQDLDRNGKIIRICTKVEHKGMCTSPLFVGEDKRFIRKDHHIWGLLILRGRQLVEELP